MKPIRWLMVPLSVFALLAFAAPAVEAAPEPAAVVAYQDAPVPEPHPEVETPAEEVVEEAEAEKDEGGGIWALLDKPIVITGIAMAFLALLNFLAKIKPEWEKYLGYIITAIKLAEKLVPDGTPNKGLARLDFAFKEVIKQWEADNPGKAMSDKAKAAIKAAIPIVHADLQAKSALSTTPGSGE